jgi:hypothetical protein
VNLKAYIRRCDGRVERLAGDESDPRNVPQGFTKSSAIPGGWTSCSFTLAREALRRDLDPYDELIVHGDGNQVIFEGYGIEYPGGEDDTVTVTATGWSSYLKDNPCPTVIAVDRDLSRWQDPAGGRKAGLSPTFQPISGAEVTDDSTTALPSLRFVLPAVTASQPYPLAESWYDAGPGAKVASIYYDMISTSGAGDTGRWSVADNDAAGGEAQGPDLLTGTNSASAGTRTPATPKRFGYFTFYGSGSATATERLVTLRKLAVYGDHPIPRIPVSGEPDGVLASDVLAHVLRTGAPLLNTRIGPGGIEPTSFVIPHLVLRDLDTVEDGVMQVNRFDISDWGVYGNRTFFMRPPGTGRTFVARTDDDGVVYSDAGITGDDVYTGVIVSYTDPSGKTLTAGPLGSGCDTETTALNTWVVNPLNKRGRNRIGRISISETAVERDAIQTAQRWIQEKARLETRGDAEVSGWIRDTAGIACPVSEIKAGDQIIFPDREWKARRIVEETYSAETDTTSLSLDAMPSKIDAMLERMGVFNQAENI